MPKRGYKRQPQPHQSPSLPTLTMAEIAAAEAVGPDVIPIVGTPAHVGMVPISQPGDAFAVWADPLVQGIQPDGTAASTVSPVLVSGKGTDGNQHAVSTDNSGNLNVAGVSSLSSQQQYNDWIGIDIQREILLELRAIRILLATTIGISLEEPN